MSTLFNKNAYRNSIISTASAPIQQHAAKTILVRTRNVANSYQDATQSHRYRVADKQSRQVEFNDRNSRPSTTTASVNRATGGNSNNFNEIVNLMG